MVLGGYTPQTTAIGVNDFLWGQESGEVKRENGHSYFDAQESMCLLA
jgi:hypothetical protein